MAALLDVSEGGAGAALDSALDTARSIIAAVERADGSSPISDQAMLAAAQGQRALLLFSSGDARGAGDARDASADAHATADRGAAPIAVGVVGQGELDLAVAPEARGRGVGTAALAALLERAAAERLGSGADAGLRAWTHGENPAGERLLERAGFSPVRTLLRMALDPARLPDDGRDPLALPAPDGMRLRAYDPSSSDDAAAWVRTNAAAFASHPEQGRITEADFALMREEPWFDAADLLLLETADGALAGSTWVKTVRDADTDSGSDAGSDTDTDSAGVETELYAVGVHPDFAGRGLGRLLLDATLARMAQHRPARVTLYVDGENERAVELYRHASFTVDSRSRQWARPALSAVGDKIEA